MLKLLQMVFLGHKLFAPDSNSQSGKLVLPNIEESFDTDWTATTYTVEIIADSNLA